MDFCVLYVSSNGYIYKSNIYNVCFTTVCITLEIPCVDKNIRTNSSKKKQAKPWLTNDG